jgi:hypothetical protein
MWTFIIIVVAIIIIKFLYDSQKQNVQVAKEGGMRNKYSLVVHHILDGDSRARIIKETASSIDIGMVSAGGATSFFLTQTYGKLTVQWKMRSPVFGNHSLEWDFPEFLDQEKMLERMNNDLEKYQMNVMRAQGGG